MPQASHDVRPLHPDPIISGHDQMPAAAVYRRPQGLKDHVLVLTIEGVGYLGPQRKKLKLEPGDLVLVDPEYPLDQDVPMSGPWPRIWASVALRPAWNDWVNWPRPLPGYRLLRLPSVQPDAPVRVALEAMHHHITGAQRCRGELALNAMEAALLHCDAHNPRTESARLDPRLSVLLEEIGRRLETRWTLDNMAGVAGLSVPHLTRLFRRQFHVSPMKLIERLRLQRAEQLLQWSAEPVAEIARQVGFDDPFYFSTRFRLHAGHSPRDYRRHKHA
ncbi:MAG: helix-turn-helix domain-containing protein [Phycisphaeraceae bacterium]|nr:helix-turn-helix domain-containing protein [Phycisphaeraceae bacterium]